MAARFWVGGTGPWDSTSTANWAATSGGASGASAPTSADNVTFDSNSGTGTATADATAACFNCTINSSTLEIAIGGAAVISNALTHTLGHLKVGSSTLTANVYASNNANARTLTFTSGKIVLTGSGTTILSATTIDNMTVSGTPTFEATYSGSTGTRTMAWGQTSGGTEAKAINVTVSAGSDTVAFNANAHYRTITLTGFSGSVGLQLNNVYGGLTQSATMTVTGTSGITFKATSGSHTITNAGQTWDRNVTINAAGATYTFADALTLAASRTLALSGGTIKFKNGVTSSAPIWTVSDVTIGSSTPGSRATLSQATGTVTASNATISDTAATGGASWLALLSAGNVDGGNNTGWRFYQHSGGLSLGLGFKL